MRRTILFSTIVPLLLSLLSASGCFSSPEEDELELDVHDLRKVAALIENDNQKMWQEIESRAGAEPYIVVDTGSNKLYLRQDEKVLLEAVASTGSGKMLEEQGGRKWTFNTPKGIFIILGKEEDPVWYKPDWAFVEDNLPIPPPESPLRVVKGMLGKYALNLGGGYKIHGTPYKKLLGQSVSHGCIRLSDHDMEKLYHSADVGTKVYIY